MILKDLQLILHVFHLLSDLMGLLDKLDRDQVLSHQKKDHAKIQEIQQVHWIVPGMSRRLCSTWSNNSNS